MSRLVQYPLFTKKIFPILIVFGSSIVSLFLIGNFSLGEFYTTAYILSLTLPAGISIWLQKKTLQDYGLFFSDLGKQFLWGIGGTLVVLIIFSFCFFLYLFYKKISWQWPSHFSIWKMLYVHVLLIALPEEFLFRGYIQENFKVLHKPSSSASYISIIETSFLFALAHMILGGNWMRIEVFFPSLFFGWIKEKSTFLGPSILIHGFSNMLYFFFFQGTNGMIGSISNF